MIAKQKYFITYFATVVFTQLSLSQMLIFYSLLMCIYARKGCLILKNYVVLNGLNQDLINNIIKSIDDLNDTNFVFNKFTKEIYVICVLFVATIFRLL